MESIAGAHTMSCTLAPPLLIPSRTAAQVVTIHDLAFSTIRNGHPQRCGVTTPDLVGTLARRAAQVVVPSRHTGSEVERRLGRLRCDISVPTAHPPGHTVPSGPRRAIFLFVGTLAPRKNVGVLLDAYATLLNRRADLPPLVLAGPSTPEAGAVLARLNRPPLQGRVRTTGYLTKAELRGYYEGARVLVLPSLDEGFGLPALEAMTVGVPVVVADRGALPEIVEGAGLLVDPSEAAAVANAIERMITDEDLALRCVDRGFERAAAYSWRASADQLRQAYAKAFEHANRDRRA